MMNMFLWVQLTLTKDHWMAPETLKSPWVRTSLTTHGLQSRVIHVVRYLSMLIYSRSRISEPEWCRAIAILCILSVPFLTRCMVTGCLFGQSILKLLKSCLKSHRRWSASDVLKKSPQITGTRMWQRSIFK